MRRLISFIVSIFAFALGTAFAQENPAAFVAALHGEAGFQGRHEQPLAIFVEASMREAYLSKELRAGL